MSCKKYLVFKDTQINHSSNVLAFTVLISKLIRGMTNKCLIVYQKRCNELKHKKCVDTEIMLQKVVFIYAQMRKLQ